MPEKHTVGGKATVRPDGSPIRRLRPWYGCGSDCRSPRNQKWREEKRPLPGPNCRPFADCTIGMMHAIPENRNSRRFGPLHG